MFLSVEVNEEELYYIYGYEEHKDKVTAIQLIEYTPDSVVYLPSDNWDHYPEVKEYKAFDFEKMKVIEELNEEDFEAFTYDLSLEKVYNNFARNRDSGFGQAFRVVYNDGSFLLVSWGSTEIEELSDEYPYRISGDCVCEYNADGSLKNWIVGYADTYYLFVAANYFETKIEEKLWDIGGVQLK